ncbi:hypothetical protein X751_21670 [Mesorhizobium sp. LNJC395A00]|nr:hypothetical protein X751_21670 [Mesorhizobium sp. LNJC395A00]
MAQASHAETEMKFSKLCLDGVNAVAFPSYVSRPLGPVDLLGIGAGRAHGRLDPRRKTMLSEDMAAPSLDRSGSDHNR